MKVLIASYPTDETAHIVARKLDALNQKYVFMSFNSNPQEFSGSISLNGKEKKIEINFQNEKIDPTQIKSVWWRRPWGQLKIENLSLLEKYVQSEFDVLNGSMTHLFTNALWVSNPDNTRNANLKPIQLILANEVGLQTPITYFGNSIEEVTNFLDSNKDIEFIMKPIGSAYVHLTADSMDSVNANKAIFTRITSRDTILENIARIPYCPFILQEAIRKSFDVRVTVVHNSVFASKIEFDNQGDSTLLDWKHYGHERKYSYHKLPDEIEEACVEITKRLGLFFGCIDLGYSDEKGYYFFEINPQGQWVPSEIIVGHSISNEIANLLVNNQKVVNL